MDEKTTVLEVSGISKAFEGLVAVRNVSFRVSRDETLGIIGPNGAGKTTLFSIISGFTRPDAGQIFFAGKQLVGMRPDQICKLGLMRTFQLVQSFPNLTAIENIMVGAFSRHPEAPVARREAEQWLDFSGISTRKWQMPAKNLTLVDKKRLELARALAAGARMILADEAMSGLNPTEVIEVIDFIRKIKQKGITIVLIEHVMKVVMDLSDRIIMLQHGEKIVEGLPREIVKDSTVVKAYLGEENPFA
jgi:branched-chain amino acid transport system ATP-binding protein